MKISKEGNKFKIVSHYHNKAYCRTEATKIIHNATFLSEASVDRVLLTAEMLGVTAVILKERN